MDDLDRRVVEKRIERRVRLRNGQRAGPRLPSLRRAAEDAADVDADPSQRFDVDGADEARPDHRRADAGHARGHRAATTRSTNSPLPRSLRISFSRPSGSTSRLITTCPSYVSGVAPMRGVASPRHSKSSTGSHARLRAERYAASMTALTT